MNAVGRGGVAVVPVVLALLTALGVVGCSGVPGAPGSNNVDVAQTVMEMGEAVNALRQETALLQWQVDSLGTVVAQQDSVIRQLAGIAGVPVPVR